MPFIPKLDLLCIGMAVMDNTFNITHHPTEDEKLRASSSFCSPGGPAATAAATTACLGSNTGLICSLGKDPAGQFLINQWQEMGLTQVFKLKAKHTASACILLKPNGERSVINSEALPKKAKNLKFSDTTPRYILCDGRLHAECLDFIKHCKSLGSKIILDAGSVSEGTLSLTSYCDYLITSKKFAQEFTNLDDSRAALRVLRQHSEFAAITLGSEGVIAQDSEQFIYFESEKIEAINTNNAGDIFHGAFCHALIDGAEFFQAIAYANDVAGAHCTHKNVVESLKSLRDSSV